MSIFFDEDTALNPNTNSSWSKGERTGGWDNWTANKNAFVRSEMFTSEYNNLEEEYHNIISIATKNGHTDIAHPLESAFNWQTGQGALDFKEVKTKEELEIEFWQNFEELQKTDFNLSAELTTAGLDTKEKMLETIAKKAHKGWSDAAEIGSRSTLMGKIGGFGGIAYGAFHDPLMLATIPVSFGYSVPATFGAAALRVAYMEAIIGGVAETLINVKSQPYRAELGFEDAGWKRALLNISTVAGASAVAAPILLGVLKAGGYSLKGLAKGLSKLSNKELQKVYKEVKTINPKVQDKNLETIKIQEQDSPLIDTVNARSEHNHKINTTIKNIVNDEPLEITPIPENPIKVDLTSTEKHLIEFDVDKLEFDPKTFQYKTGGDLYGITGKLKNVSKWDQPSSGTIIVYEFANGKKVVVDGHQRLGLAKKLKDRGQNPKLYGYLYREVDGISTEQAMVMGVAANLRQNTGSAIDAAKILRTRYGKEVWSSVERSLPPQTKLVKEAAGLSKLSDDAFGMVVNGKTNQTFASRVGELIEDKTLHAQILNNLKAKTFSNIQEMDIFLRSINRLPKTTTKQTTLFGEEELSSLLLLERSKLLNYASRNIKEKSSAFKTIVQKEDILTDAGNVLNKDKNIERSLINDKILDRLEQVATLKGELSTELSRAAKTLKEGKTSQAQKEFLEAIERAAARGDFDGITTSRPLRTDEVKTEVPSSAKEQTSLAEDINNTKNFEEPGGTGVTNQADSIEGSLFEEGIPLAIKTEGGATSAAKTDPTPKPLAKTQDLVPESQVTEVAPPSTVVATATTTPPLILGSTTKRVGDMSSVINDRIYHISNDFNTIYKTLSAKLPEVTKWIENTAKKYNGEFKARLKVLEEAKSKNKFVPAESLSDILGVRLLVNSINEAKVALNGISKSVRLIHIDDFLDDIGRSNKGSEYRAIHAQVLTKDGYTFELQIRLKALEKSTDKSHAIYKQLKWNKDYLTADEIAKLQGEQVKINAELKAGYFKAQKKEFAILKTDNPLDMPIAVGTRIDDVTGERVTLTRTARELFEEEGKDLTMLKRLKDCI